HPPQTHIWGVRLVRRYYGEWNGAGKCFGFWISDFFRHSDFMTPNRRISIKRIAGVHIDTLDACAPFRLFDEVYERERNAPISSRDPAVAEHCHQFALHG